MIEGEGEKQKITVKAIKARLKEIGRDADLADEREALLAYSALIEEFDGRKRSSGRREKSSTLRYTPAITRSRTTR